MTRALALGCLLGAGLVCAYAWATRKPRAKGQLGQPAPLGKHSVDSLEPLFARSWRDGQTPSLRPRISLWCNLCGCELLPDGRCPDRDKVHPT